MTTSLIEMLELPNLGSRDPKFQNTFILRVVYWPRVANFADIIKIATIFIKITFKGSKKLKLLEIMH